MGKSPQIQWSAGLIVREFGLTRILENYPLLDSWLDVKDNLSEEDKEMLEKRRKKLLKRVNSWNEETLKMKFIAFLLDMVDYDVNNYEGVFEAEMKAVVKNYSLKVITDFTVAKVTEDLIEHPYFYFHEYKAKKKSKDPIAQVLLAMIIAQEQNQNGKPIYGCHVIGEQWYFMVMHGQEYAIAEGLSATQSSELQQILLVLRRFKDILLTDLLVN